MENSISKTKVSFAILFIVLIFIIFSSLINIDQHKKEAEMRENFLAEQKAMWEAQEKIYLMGKFEPAQREDFAPVGDEYNVGGYKMYLRKEVLADFLKMRDAADRDDIDLNIASATRNFDYQRNIWNNKWTGVTLVDGKKLNVSIPDELERFKKILEYSAVPGTSRHHWGTDIDINNATPEYFKTEEGREVYEWLNKNAPLFGFCQPYTLKGSARPEGYNEEKWHWSYTPLARVFTEEYKNLIKEEDINGFWGDKYVPGQDLINDYVLAINPDCL